MSETSTEQTAETTPEAAHAEGQETGGEQRPNEAAEETDWRDKFEGQRKVNRDLEAKFKKASAEAERASELESKLAKLEGREAEFEQAKNQREAEQAALAKANDRIRRSEVKAAAAGKLADPADAHNFLDLSKFEVDDDGNVDEDEIAEAIDELITKKPYLAAQGGRRFQGTADGGARNGSTKPSQLTQADLRGMSPEEIGKARKEGRLDDLLGRSK